MAKSKTVAADRIKKLIHNSQETEVAVLETVKEKLIPEYEGKPNIELDYPFPRTERDVAMKR